ncbi:hypothetical protein J31TS4_31210 [Paenibacillus sp. J31TS4]|nr:hypothetical protein J31TS4_31210 [Paenibacillus sp. J31TS4]
MPLVFHHDNLHLRQAVKPLGKYILSGNLNFQNEVGLTELELRMHGQVILRMELEIFPSKMDYKSDYQAILNDVNQQIYNLSFDFMRKTYHLTGLRETRSQSLTEFFTLLQHVFEQLTQAVERIKNAPHASMQADHRVVDTARVKRAGKGNIPFLIKHPHLLLRDDQHGYLSIQGQRYSPSHVLETKRHIDFNTHENRFVRWVLLRITSRLVQLSSRLVKQGRPKDPLLVKRIKEMQGQLQRILKYDFLQVGEMRHLSITLVLQMATGYREVYRYYLLLMKGLSIQNDLMRLSMKDVAQLYEYWCFLKIHDLLSRKYELLKQDLIKVNRSGLFATLDKSQQAKMVYRNPANGEVFTLYYNALPRGDRSPTLSQRPDNVLTLKKNDAATEYKYIFDAKYRLNPAYEGTTYYYKYTTPGPEEEDINTMHRYRDAIVYMDEQDRDYERSMFGAYVLFPYQNEEQYENHRFYKSIELVNVGAFPFLPNATRLLETFLDELILDSPEKAYERSTQPRGTKDYYRNKWSGKNVLVGSLRGASQLEAILEHGFYHMPLANITDHRLLTQLEYVALYQSRTKFSSTGQPGIHWYGRISEWKVLRRKEIEELPPKAGTEEKLYVKFSINQWERRKAPIVPGGRGIYTALYTSKYMFDRAREIAELKLETEEDLMKWREQRRVGRVQVELDHEQVDLARHVLGVHLKK